ncbi:hypothetical protein BASA81_001417 [Batrachochytrium salamandrivorans]|nr:hypothetical protein BASA81_001417 [Batrachochytrium salamandrivorans]
MEHAFGGATELARKSGSKLSKSAQLQLYTLFKQATEGDLPTNKQRPSAFSVIERTKHDTWDRLRGMSKPEAKSAYVQAVLDANIGFVLPSPIESSSDDEKVAAPPPTTTTIASPKVVTIVHKEEELNSPLDTLLATFSVPTLVCMGMFGGGLSGFVLSILSWNALMCLGFALLGLGGMLGSLLMYIDTHGLISMLPSSFKQMLVETTLLEFMLNDSLSRLVQQLAPVFLLDRDDPRMKLALANLSPSASQLLTQKGLVHSLPRFVQNLLVPSGAREVILTNPPPMRELPVFPPVAAEDEAKLDAAKQLSAKLVKEKVDQGLRGVFTPKSAKLLEMASVSLASATLLQLLFSSSNRAFLASFVRALVLMGSMAGSGLAAALALLAKVLLAKRTGGGRG